MTAVQFPHQAWNTILQAADKAGVVVPQKLFALDELFFDPSPLGHAATVWEDDIKAGLARIAGEIEHESGRTTDHWRGPASEGFRDWTFDFSREIKEPTGEPLAKVASALRDLEQELTDFQHTLVSTLVQLAAEATTALLGGDLVALAGFIGTVITTLIGLVDTLDSAMDTQTAVFNALGSDMEGIGRVVASLGAKLATDAELSKLDDTSKWRPR